VNRATLIRRLDAVESQLVLPATLTSKVLAGLSDDQLDALEAEVEHGGDELWAALVAAYKSGTPDDGVDGPLSRATVAARGSASQNNSEGQRS
jgi:hypothetical protein